MKYYIFGGSGFVGHSLAEALLADGKEVCNCDLVHDERMNASRGGTFLPVDITDTDALRAVPLTSEDVVVHLAARQYHLPVPRQHRREFFFDVNYQGTANLLSAMQEKGCRKLIYFSTDMTYGKPEFLPVTTDHPQHPFGPYGASKKASENLCRRYRRQGLSVTIFRPRMILGPGRLGILKKLFRLMEWNLPVPMIGSGKNCYQMISVYDCVSAIQCCIRKGIPNREYNLGSENPPTVRELLSGTIRKVGSHSILLPTSGPLVKKSLALLGKLGIDIMYREQYEIADEDYIVDITATKQELGWTPRYNDEDMLAQAYEYYEQEKAAR